MHDFPFINNGYFDNLIEFTNITKLKSALYHKMNSKFLTWDNQNYRFI